MAIELLSKLGHVRRLIIQQALQSLALLVEVGPFRNIFGPVPMVQSSHIGSDLDNCSLKRGTFCRFHIDLPCGLVCAELTAFSRDEKACTTLVGSHAGRRNRDRSIGEKDTARSAAVSVA